MPRLPRINVADGLYHVTNRGLEQRDIVRDDEDRQEWVRLLGRVATRSQWRVFAWTLLDNHFHIFVRTPQPNLSEAMHDLESGYASLFNRRHERRGPLLQGRFHAVLVEAETHALELTRYVHLNCCRAGLTEHPARYHWHSYPAYLGVRRAPGWLDWQTMLGEFGGTEGAARISYRRFIEAGLNSSPVNPLANVVDGWLLGSDLFVEKWRHAAGNRMPEPASLETIVAAVAGRFGAEPSHLRQRGRHANGAREAAIALARELRGDALADVAEYFGRVSRSAITETVRRARLREASDDTFRDLLRSLRDELS